MDNLVTGDETNLDRLGAGDFTFVKHNITEHITVDGPLDYVFHFASPASPIDYLEMPIQTLKVGRLGTHKALGLAKEKGAVLLLASTSEVYGDPLVHPQKEDYWGNVNPIGPRGVYDEAKRFAEAMTMAYHRTHGVDTRIVRIFNTYGPRMRIRDGRAIPNFICQALRGEDITVYGDGTQTRSFCSIRDMVPGFALILEKGSADPVNLGNPGEYTVVDLARKIVEMTGSSSRIVHTDLPVDDPKVRQPDISRATATLGWKPGIHLDEGLKETIDYFRAKVGAGDGA
jgi:dTDP-glucose 4,6-dehydratase